MYIVGKTKIVIKNSSFKDWDILPTVDSIKRGKLDTALLVLRHPRSCFSLLRHQMPKDRALLTRTAGIGTNSPSHDSRGRPHHAGAENGSSYSNIHGDNDRMAGLGDERVEGASHHGDNRDPSRHNRRGSRPGSRQSPRDPTPVIVPPQPMALGAVVNVQPRNVVGDVEQKPRTGSGESNVVPPRAINPYVPNHGNPKMVDHARAQSAAEKDPALLDQLPGGLSKKGQGPSRSRRVSQSSSLHTERDYKRNQALNKQKVPPKLPPSAKSAAALKALAVRNEVIRRDQPRKKPEVPPRLSMNKRNEGKRKRSISAVQDRALMNDLGNSARYQKQREKLV